MNVKLKNLLRGGFFATINKPLLGSILVLLAAFFWGFTPIIAKLTYTMGSNAVNMAFLRNLLALPILFVLLRWKRVSFKLSAKEVGILCVLGICNAFTTILLYMSYDYIPVGIATTLNSSFPILVMIGSVVLFKQKIARKGIISLVVTMTGIAMFFSVANDHANMWLGTSIAFLSAICYAAYVLIFDKSDLKEHYAFKLTFYTCMINSVCCLVFGLAQGNITFALTSEAWVYSAIVALLCSVCCITFFQLGIKYVGSVTASILVMAEPVVSIVLGVICLHESLTVLKVMGCVLIITGLLILQIKKKAESRIPWVFRRGIKKQL